MDRYEENIRKNKFRLYDIMQEYINNIFSLFVPVEINQNRNAICHIINSIFNFTVNLVLSITIDILRCRINYFLHK